MHRDGDRLLQLLIFNEEFLVSACHQRALITSLPFVHTARRSYRLNDPVRPPDWCDAVGSPAAMPREAVQTLSFRGRRSRNKVSVGEPAEGSLPVFPPTHCAHRMRPGSSAAAALQRRSSSTQPRLGAAARCCISLLSAAACGCAELRLWHLAREQRARALISATPFLRAAV